jgi:hypothetical protein
MNAGLAWPGLAWPGTHCAPVKCYEWRFKPLKNYIMYFYCIFY